MDNYEYRFRVIKRETRGHSPYNSTKTQQLLGLGRKEKEDGVV